MPLKIYGIAACDPQGVMGKEGKLPWHYPEDLKHFQKTTQDQILVMGYQTFLTLPKIFFEDRITIVFSRKNHLESTSNLIFVSSIEDFLSLPLDKDCFVIGGAQIFKLFLEKNLIEKLILTKLKKQYAGDTLFPLSSIDSWKSQKVHENDAFTIYHYLQRYL